MAILSAFRSLSLEQRQLQCILRAVLLVAGLAVLVSLHAGRLLWGLFSSHDLLTLLSVLGGLLLLLIPIAGIISVTSQYAFWEGWLEGLPLPWDLFSPFDAAAAGPRADGGLMGESAEAVDAHGTAAVAVLPAPNGIRRYVIYLDGIHQQERDHPPRVSAFLDRLESALPSHTLLVRGLEAYTVSRSDLRADQGGAWFWQRLFALQEHHGNPLVRSACSFLVQANNVIKVGISSDRRYGPILNYELALKIAQRLAELGFHPDHGCDLALLGYSGGGEMAMGSAAMLQRLCRSAVRIITFCGVFSANQELDAVSAICTIVGSRDPVAGFGRIAYPGRLPLLFSSQWNRQRRRGRIRRLPIEGMNHNGAGGPFGELHRDQVVALVAAELETQPASAGSRCGSS